ncbi:hypothetical protein HII31_06088 [Pseudocercospora fuligena]|uniref:Proteasome subunit beta type protein n=1 Tax=Pseudocercospora fuligena TaxID=685502 RepID=A0A8H6RJC7_9PEZI|nr:hypothetical protein HII31_06088 [Pseudocercospora fuligena]
MATNIPTVEDLKEFLPMPANIDAVADPDKVDVAQSMTEKPTASHALAMADHDEKGAAQETHDDEVKDLGWTDHVDQIENPLVGGMHNEDLWVLVRRFNKQMYHVKEYPYPVPGNLDLNIADEEEFSPDKLRANVERLYMTVIIGLMGAAKQIMRLRSWREARRTTYFCAAYFIAWAFDFLTPLFLSVVIALIVYPPCREILFPPAPLALVSASTGGVQKPKAGVLGSTDSATGAPEKHKGEAVEAEASNVVNSIASVALSSVAGKHPQNEPPHAENSKGNDSVPDPTALAMSASNARSKTGGEDSVSKDKTKVPMETAIWNKMRPIMHGIADISDTWERFGNALSPTSPFPRDLFRLRIAAVVVPLLGVSIFVTSYMLVKGITFGVGFGFFGDPVIQQGLVWLNSHFPKWQKLLELRNTLLKGVPTNAQLTITLLRIGEANKAPIPPPHFSHGAPPDEPVELTEDELRAAGADWPLNATDEEIKAAIAPDSTTAHETAGTDVDESKKKSHGKAGAKILGFLRGNVKASVDTALGVDHLKAKAGSEPSKQRLGVIPSRNESKLSGPIDFKCRYHGKKGHAYIATKATIPCIGFSLDKNITSKDGSGDLNSELRPVWTVALADIKELKKIGGLGWKSKLVVGWALDREVADGLEIVDKLGNSWIVTAMVLRDELFNRLVAMGGQKWEAW